MRTRIAWGILLACCGGAQSRVPSPPEIDAVLRADLRGDSDAPPNVKGIPPGPAPIQIEPPASSSNRPSAASISVTQLRHKVPKRARQAVGRGARFSQSGDHARAAAEFAQAIAWDPACADAHDRLGAEYAQLGRYAESEAELRRSIALDPAAWAAHYDLAVTLYRTGDFAAAELSVRRALELSSANPPVHLLLGVLLCRSEETRADGVRHLQYAARTIPAARELLGKLEPNDTTH